MNIQVGQAAPDFKLFNTDKKEISLSDYKGKNLVILFLFLLQQIYLHNATPFLVDFS